MKIKRRMLPTAASKFAFFTNMPRKERVCWVPAKESYALELHN